MPFQRKGYIAGLHSILKMMSTTTSNLAEVFTVQVLQVLQSTRIFNTVKKMYANMHQRFLYYCQPVFIFADQVKFMLKRSALLRIEEKDRNRSQTLRNKIFRMNIFNVKSRLAKRKILFELNTISTACDKERQ